MGSKVHIAIWIFFTILALFVLLYTLANNIMRYLEYPMKSEYEILFKDKRHWPEITFCSLKPLDVSSVTIMNDVIKGTNAMSGQQPSWKPKFMDFEKNAKVFVNAYSKMGQNNTGAMEMMKKQVNQVFSVQGLIKNIDEEFAQAVVAKNFVVGCDFDGEKCSVTPKFSKEDGLCTSIHLKNKNSMQAAGDQVLTITAFAGETAEMDMMDMNQGNQHGFKVYLKENNMEEHGDEEGEENGEENGELMGKSIGDFMAGQEYSMKITETQFKMLEPPYGMCDDDATDPTHCLKECRNEMMENYCGCSAGRCLEIPYVAEACAGSSMTEDCATPLKEFHKRNNCSYHHQAKEPQCDCERPCKHSLYDVTETSRPIEHTPSVIEAHWSNLDDTKKNVISSAFTNFDLKTQTAVFKVALDPKLFASEQVVAFTLVDLFSELYLHLMIVILVVANLIYAVRKGRSNDVYLTKA